jgi:hypothetical protein
MVSAYLFIIESSKFDTKEFLYLVSQLIDERSAPPHARLRKGRHTTPLARKREEGKEQGQGSRVKGLDKGRRPVPRSQESGEDQKLTADSGSFF